MQNLKLGYVLLLAIMPLCKSNVSYALSMPSVSSDRSSESVRWGDVTCNTNHTPAATLQMGLIGTDYMDNGTDTRYEQDSRYRQDRGEAGAYIAINIPIGVDAKVDCNRLYDMALRTKELEIEKLRKELELLTIKSNLNTFTE